MILTHGANSIKRGGGIPTGFVQIWGITGAYNPDITFTGTDAPAMSGHSNVDCDIELTITPRLTVGSGAYSMMCTLGHTYFGLGVSDDGLNWQMWGNNGDWYPQGQPLQKGPVSNPVSSHSTHVITLYHETMTDTVDGQTFTSDQIWWWNRGDLLTNATVFVSGNFEHQWYFNRCRIIVHDTGEVLFDVIPLKSSSDGKAYFYDLVGKTLKTNRYGTLTPQDTNPYAVEIGGRMYPTVTIGNQLWMAENLDYKFDGCAIGPSGTPSTPAAWYYNNDEATYGANGNKYGLLYNWYAVDYLNQHLSELGIPTGWHVATENEFQTMINHSGLSQLSILPSGYYIPGSASFEGGGSVAHQFTSTLYNAGNVYFFEGTGSSGSIGIGSLPTGRSIRLVEDAT